MRTIRGWTEAQSRRRPARGGVTVDTALAPGPSAAGQLPELGAVPRDPAIAPVGRAREGAGDPRKRTAARKPVQHRRKSGAAGVNVTRAGDEMPRPHSLLL